MRQHHKVKNLAGLMLLLTLFFSPAARAEQERKVRSKVGPEVPPIVRQMKLAGTVRIEIVIAANGLVKSTKALGGHPLLIQCAEEALKKWRYEPGPETTTVIEFRFNEH